MSDRDRLDRALESMNAQLVSAETEEDFQTVGLLARETLISLAQVVFDSNSHSVPDRTNPSSTDAKRMLDAYLGSVLPGSGNEELGSWAAPQ